MNQEQGDRLRIGKVAAQSPLSRDAVRFSERLGLLEPLRTSSGYRLYATRAVDRLRFIKRAQSFGSTLDQIKQMLTLDTADPRTCFQAVKLIERQLEELGSHHRPILPGH